MIMYISSLDCDASHAVVASLLAVHPYYGTAQSKLDQDAPYISCLHVGAPMIYLAYYVTQGVYTVSVLHVTDQRLIDLIGQGMHYADTDQCRKMLAKFSSM
jgi:hypothetical protein